MKRLTTTLAAAVLLGVFAMPPVTMADEDDHSRIVQSMKKTFEAAKMAAKRLPTFRDGAVVQRHRAIPGDLDYESFGYWLNAPSRPNARPAVGAWAAGPVEWKAPEVPLTGAAWYNGTAKGLFVKHQKSSPHAPLQNLRIEGTFTAPVFLSAYFEELNPKANHGQTIQGWVGSYEGNSQGISVTARYVRTNVAGPARAYGAQLNYGVSMGASLNSDGTWRSDSPDDVFMRDFSTDSLPTKTGGAWGGRLIAGDKFPASAIGEKAIGTFGAWMNEDNGNKTVLLGGFSTGPGLPAVIGRGDNTCSAITGTGICGSPEFIELAERAYGDESE